MMNLIEPFQLACKTCSHGWSFAAGVATYAAVQAGALNHLVSASRLVLPPQFHFTLVILLTLISMFVKMATFRIRSSMASILSKLASFTTEAPAPATASPIVKANPDADKPTRPMRKPRVIDQNLTSVEFMPPSAAGLSQSKDKEREEEVKID
jgi:hypothetical protein